MIGVTPTVLSIRDQGQPRLPSIRPSGTPTVYRPVPVLQGSLAGTWPFLVERK